MTATDRAARNRANAARSTGPRTPSGKTIVARNARRHGATARPEADHVLTWLRIILGRPDLDVSGLFLGGARAVLALALAEAEVRLAAAARVLAAFESGQVAPWVAQLQLDAGLMLSLLAAESPTPWERRVGLGIVARLDKTIASETEPGGERHRLLRRYLAEARARRRKAFAAWIAHEWGGEEAREAA